MATKIKKGVEVWLFIAWNDRATICAKRLTVTSWGKVQGTAICTENGKPIRKQLWVNLPNGYSDAPNIIPVADMPDPTEEGMRRAREHKARNIQHHVDRIHHYSSDPRTSDGYYKAMKDHCEKVLAEEPTLIIRD